MKTNRTISLGLVAAFVFAAIAISANSFAFNPDAELKGFAEKMDKKYFPIFLNTFGMINRREFQGLDIFFTGDLLVDHRPPTKIVSVETWGDYEEIFYRFQKTSFSSDMDDKGYKIAFPIDWGANPIKNNSWVFYFHNLIWLNDFLLKGEQGDANSALIAFKVIHDWIISNAQWPAKHGKFVYGDHSTAERLKVFYRAMRLYKKIQYRDDEFFKLLLTGILNHIALMASEEKYLNWHNHGIIFDKCLLEVLKDFPEFKMRKEVQDLAVKRCLEQFRFAFTSEGIHKEHSPCYHYFVTCMLLKSVDLIEESGQNVPVFLKDLADKSSEFYAYILKPDGTFPNFGDCSGGKKWSPNQKYLNAHPELQYALTDGKTGKRPSELFKIFPQSGWAIFRDKWPSDVYAAIQSDFHSFGHYQEDDTSFMLNAFGHDLVIDPGLHTYDKNPIDIYMRKARAHNVLIVDDIDFNFNLANTGLSGITRFAVNEDSTQKWRAIVELTHPHYKHLGVKIYRQFGQIGDTSFVIKDVIKSNKPHNYTQLYHLASGAKIEPRTAGTFKISWETHDCILWLKSDFDSYDIIEGSMNPVQGWCFPKFGTAVSQPVLRLHRTGMIDEFATLASISKGSKKPAWNRLYLSAEDMFVVLRKLPRRRLEKQPVPARWSRSGK